MTLQHKRTIWLIAIATPFVAVVLYVVYWFVAANQLAVAISAWQDEQRTAGIHIDYQGLHIDGFPGAFRVTMDAPRVERRTSMMSWSWSSRRLVSHTGPWSFNAVHGEVIGDHSLVILNLTTSGSYIVATERAEFSLRAANQRVRGSLRLRDARIDGGRPDSAVVVKGVDISVEVGQGENAGGVVVDIDASGLRPPAAAVRFAKIFDRVSLRAIWTGSIPESFSYAALSRWRDSGGVVELPRAFIKLGDVSLSADGTVALDQEMRPVAAFKAKIQGFEAGLQMLTDAQDLSPTQSAALRIGLRLMAKRSNQPGTVEFPLTLQEGRAYFGKIPIGHLKPIIRRPADR